MVGFCLRAICTASLSVRLATFGLRCWAMRVLRDFFEIRHHHLLLHGEIFALLELSPLPLSSGPSGSLSCDGAGKGRLSCSESVLASCSTGVVYGRHREGGMRAIRERSRRRSGRRRQSGRSRRQGGSAVPIAAGRKRRGKRWRDASGGGNSNGVPEGVGEGDSACGNCTLFWAVAVVTTPERAARPRAVLSALIRSMEYFCFGSMSESFS